jgi:hypothetical protein
LLQQLTPMPPYPVPQGNIRAGEWTPVPNKTS